MSKKFLNIILILKSHYEYYNNMLLPRTDIIQAKNRLVSIINSIFGARLNLGIVVLNFLKTFQSRYA